MVGRAVQTQVDAERHGRPGRVLGATVKTCLIDGQRCPGREEGVRTLFAGFNLSFWKMVWDCALVALIVERENVGEISIEGELNRSKAGRQDNHAG